MSCLPPLQHGRQLREDRPHQERILLSHQATRVYLILNQLQQTFIGQFANVIGRLSRLQPLGNIEQVDFAILRGRLWRRQRVGESSEEISEALVEVVETNIVSPKPEFVEEIGERSGSLQLFPYFIPEHFEWLL